MSTNRRLTMAVSPLHAGTLRCHSDALVHRSTGHQASLSPGKLGGLSQIPFFTSSPVYWFRPNPKGAGTARLQVLTCRLIDPNTRFWSRMHSHGQLGRPCFQKKTPSPERGGGGRKTISGVRPPPGDRASPLFVRT